MSYVRQKLEKMTLKERSGNGLGLFPNKWHSLCSIGNIIFTLHRLM